MMTGDGNAPDRVFEVGVLGPVVVSGPDGPLDPGGRKPRLLLALLVADAARVRSTDQLIDGLWGDDPPQTARKTLQVHVSNLRRALGADFPLRTTRGGYVVGGPELTVDATEFESELARAIAVRDTDPGEAGSILTRALARWRGAPYADLADEESLRTEISRLSELRLLALEHRIDVDLRLGRADHLLGELDALTTDHPYRERFRMQHVLALYRCGRQTDALRAYEHTRRTLADELGIEPSPELRELHRQVLDQSPSLEHVPPPTTDRATAAVGAGDGVADGVRGFELRERLGGRGGATVFRAYQPSVGREVALKVIAADVANRPEFVKRFDAECRLLADLEHPHIVTLLDYWRDPDGAYLATPLFRGGTLEQSLREGPWSAAATLHALGQIGAALGYAHRRGIVHGDLRSTNVLLDGDGNVFLSDFRLDLADASLRRASIGDTAASAHDGVADASADPSADVRALALLTCELLTGDRPSPWQRPSPGRTTAIELPSAVDDVIARATDPDPARRFDRVETYLRALRRAFGADVVTAEVAAVDRDIRNPYKGLRAFGESDAADFFGREDLVAELLDHVTTAGLTVVVGPSGSGKSSLVRAGLVPAVRSGLPGGRDVVVAEMFPGSYPFEELASSLLRVAVGRPADIVSDLAADERGLMRVSKQILPDDDTDLLLVVDQFEELFALAEDESVRRAFLASLVTVASDERSRVRVVLTLRADFFDRPLQYPEFAALMRSSLVTVALPSDECLAAAIARPAAGVGLEVEPGLVPTILRDVASEPGALPMLQYALTELAESRDGDLLTVAGYRRTGGVVGALSTRAEEIYAGLSQGAQDAAREVFLRLVNVHDESDDTRRRVRRTELDGLGLHPPHLAAVIDGYGSFRLLSFDRDPVTRGPTVEVAHEALIREWPRLRSWIDARRDDLHTERRLQSVVGEWLQADRDPSLLISGGRLARYEQWAETPHVRLSDDEREFIEQSRRIERAAAVAAGRRRRRVLVGVSALAVVATVLALVAVVQRDRADDNARRAAAESARASEAATTADRLRVEAERSAAVDVARSLAAQATTIRDSDAPLLLALEAHDAVAAVGAESPTVTSALYQTAYDQRISARYPVAGGFMVGFVSPGPDGSRFVVQTGAAEVSIVDLQTGSVQVALDASDDVFFATWDPDDDVILVGTTTGVVEVFAPDGTPVQSVQVAEGFVAPVGLRDGAIDHFVATADGAIFGSVDAATGASLFGEQGSGWRGSAAIDGLGPSDTGRHVVSVDAAGVAHVYRTGTWDEAASFDAGTERGGPQFLWWVPGEDEIWVLRGSVVSRVDAATGEVLLDLETGRDDLLYVLPSPDGQLLATMADTGDAQLVLDATTGATVATLGTPFDLQAAIWSGVGRQLIMRGADEILVWSLEQPNAVSTVWPAVPFAPLVTAPLVDGSVLLASSDGRAEIWDATGTMLRRELPGGSEPDAAPVVSDDGTTVIASVGDAVEILDVGTDRVRATGPSGYPRPLAVSGDGRSLVVGTGAASSESASIAIVDGVTGELVHAIGPSIVGDRAAYTPEGASVLLPVTRLRDDGTSSGSALWLVDAATGEIVTQSLLSQGCYGSVTISHDGGTAATSGCDGELALWDLDVLAGEVGGSSARYAGTVTDPVPVVGAAFATSDDVVVATRADGRVEAFGTDAAFRPLWTFDAGGFAGIPTVHDDTVTIGVLDTMEGVGAATGGMVGIPLDVDELVAFARSSATRELTDDECRRFFDVEACSER